MVQASRRHRLRDATWLNLKSLGGKTPAGNVGWTAKESGCKVVFVSETSTTSISYIGPLLAAKYFHRLNTAGFEG
jgi:hypothetical protein